LILTLALVDFFHSGLDVSFRLTLWIGLARDIGVVDRIAIDRVGIDLVPADLVAIDLVSVDLIVIII
jgi:hypothetical protein